MIFHFSYETKFLALDSVERLEERFSKESVENLINDNLNRMFIYFLKIFQLEFLEFVICKEKDLKIEHFNGDKELTKLELEVRSDNNQAIKLYEKFGFKIEEEISKYFHINGISYSEDIMGVEK